jgi:hypothetical protein
MGRVRHARVEWFCFVAAISWFAGVRAVADSPEAVLKSSGLKPSGPLYILETEAEAKMKLSDIKQIARQLKSAKAQQEAYGTAQDHQALIRNLTAQLNEIRAESNAVGQRMNQVPRYRGRYSNYFVQEQRAEMMAYRNQLNAEVNQQNALLNQVKSHPFDPKLKDKLDSEVKSRQDDYQQAVSDLSQLVKSTQEKYGALAKDPGVKKALESLELKIRPSPKLGPSHEFHELVKTVEKLQKEAPADPFSDSKPKTTSRPKHSSRPAP